MKEDDPLFPVRQIEIDDRPGTISGVCKGAAPIQSKYGVILRLEFVSIGKKSNWYLPTGHEGAMPKVAAGSRNHTEDIYFKVMPTGTSDVTGLLLGYPALDTVPTGVGWSVKPHAHYFKICDQLLPRAELALKGKALRELQEWSGKN